MAVIGIIVALGVQLIVMLALFGWITPLGIGLVLRRTPPPRPRPWLMTSAIWGGLSLLAVVGLVVVAFVFSRHMSSDFGSTARPDAVAFDAASFPGPTVSLPVPEGMTIRMEIGAVGGDDDQAQVWTIEARDGAVVVPAGSMQLHALTFSRQDASGVEWRLGSDWDEPSPFTPGQDAPPWMGRLRAGMEVTCSPLSDDLRADLKFADEAGRPYELEAPCGRADLAQQLAMFDARGEQVWSGRFSFG